MKATICSSEYIYPDVRPWKAIFNDLIESGCHINLIAEILGKQQSTVSYWVHEAQDLPDSAARSVLNLHMRYCGHELTSVRLQQAKYKEE